MTWSSVIQSKSSYQEIYESNQIILLGTDVLMTLLCNYLVKVLVVWDSNHFASKLYQCVYIWITILVCLIGCSKIFYYPCWPYEGVDYQSKYIQIMSKIVVILCRVPMLYFQSRFEHGSLSEDFKIFPKSKELLLSLCVDWGQIILTDNIRNSFIDKLCYCPELCLKSLICQ